MDQVIEDLGRERPAELPRFPAALSLDRPVPVCGLFNTHRSRASSIYHANAMRRALSVGPDARILRPAGELRHGRLCALAGDGANAVVLALSRVRDGSR